VEITVFVGTLERSEVAADKNVPRAKHLLPQLGEC